MLTFRPVYLALTGVLLLVETLIALYVRDAFLRPYGGDFLVVILIYYFLRSFLTWSPAVVAWVTLAIAFTVEIGQAFQLVDLLGLSGNRLAEIVIGTGFSWLDMLMYALGVAAAYLLDRWWRRGRFHPQKSAP
ncbi:DUF2809 domain-containing protein [Lewinella sp. IMCC34183]|uniref:ribosomal maturation YjgA family protein n=1 Tax=Lewinella sp. IMCC34183 TaxID=2248762 RepID=UPI000E21D921|nr:DUF2809 domain-containing protein [Lewinella sp. IMCC34183]